MANSDLSGHLRKKSQSEEFSHIYRILAWFLGIAAWLFGTIDRSLAAFADGYVSAIDLMQIAIAAFLFVCWLFLKPSWRFANRKSETDVFDELSVKK
ncbi:MAG: hypothetical protein IGR93_13610 [Hydrococcus sp. C42_A2020_068]|nr:hypothetical protein [Hydrococcus sp. C42_A2020_068]